VAEVQQPAGFSGTVKAIYCYSQNAATSPATFTLLKNGVATAVSCTYTGNQGQGTGFNVAIVSTDLLAIKITSAANTNGKPGSYTIVYQ
jgi:hypothetical protein